MLDNIYDIRLSTFCVASDMSNIDFIVVLDSVSSVIKEKAMNIANNEIEKYLTLSEDDEEYDLYNELGYIGCVRKALENEGYYGDYYDIVEIRRAVCG